LLGRDEFIFNHGRMKRFFFIGVGVLAVLIGLGFVMPAVAQWRTQGSLPNLSVALLALGLILTVGGISSAFYGANHPKT
jgi:4-hydroxybenzoate polyprenyltransferase